MKLTKQLRSEILDVYEAFLGSLFNVDIEIYGQVLDDNYRLIGTTDNEVFFNKKDAINFLKATGDQLAGNIERRKSKIKIETVDDLVLITEQFDAYVLIENDWSFYGKVRVSTLMQQKTSGWKIVQQHFSLPDAKAEEGQTVGLEKITKENSELRDAIKRRTIELEHKNRELEIEAALERVRSRTMAMHKSDELSEIIEKIYNEFQKFGTGAVAADLMIITPDGTGYDIWVAGTVGTEGPYRTSGKLLNHPHHLDTIKAWKKGDSFRVTELTGNLYKSYFNLILNEPPGFVSLSDNQTTISKDRKGSIRNLKSIVHTEVFGKNSCIRVASLQKRTLEQIDIQKRFANVFEQTYTRFLDLQKAEAQAREAQIEASLERVRASSMAMHQSNDLLDVIKIVTNQLLLLGFKFNTANFAKVYADGSWDLWLTTPEQSYPDLIHVPYFDHPIFNELKDKIAKGRDSFTDVYGKEEANRFFRHFFENTIAKNAPESRKQFVLGSKGFARSLFLMKDLWLAISNYEGIPYTLEENDVFKRFAKVFEQAYTRFLDLQKAEAQAREAQIETALERVRSRSMGMQKSDELAEVVAVLYKQFEELDFGLYQVLVSIYDKKNNIIEWWSKGFSDIELPQRNIIPIIDHPFSNDLFEKWENGVEYYPHILEGEMKKSWDEYLFTKTDLKNFPTEVKETMKSFDKVYLSDVFMKYGSLQAAGPAPLPDDKAAILKRFVKVLDHAYTRMKDLQTAELQTREAQIELGLEKVRSRAMAMQTSEELNELIGTVFTELTKLDLVLTRCVIWVFDPTTNEPRWWMANSEEPSSPMSFLINYHEHPAYLTFIQEWKKQNVKFVYDLKGQDKVSWDDILFNETELKHLPDVVKNGMRAPERVLLSTSFNNFGGINVASLEPLSDEHFDIMLRFAKVFDLTYTRFNDLKQAEAQTREAEIELALERVRAKTMAMQKPSEFVDVVNVIGQQFVHLGFDIEWANFGAQGLDVADGIDTWNFAVIPGGDPVASRLFIPHFDHPIFIDAIKQLENYRMTGNDFFVMSYGKKEKDRWLDHLFTKTIFKDVPEEYRAIQYAKPGYTTSNLALKDTFLSIGKFDTRTFSDEQHAILRRFGKAFGQAYTRFLDLQKAEAQARESQIQLALERVRARTMAMQRSDELLGVVSTLYEQLNNLQFDSNACNIIIIDKESDNQRYWVSGFTQKLYPESYNVPYFKHPYIDDQLQAWKEGRNYVVIEYSGKMKHEFDKQFFSQTDFRNIPAEVQKVISALPSAKLSTAFFTYGALQIIGPNPLSEENAAILQRFAKVFDQTYTRFLDLQKAEAQAREAQIELGLERVRARAMAMQKSDELKELIGTVYNELTKLDLTLDRCLIWIMNSEDLSSRLWMANAESQPVSFYVPYHDNRPYLAFIKSWRERNTSWQYDLQGQDKKEWDDFVFDHTEMKYLPEPVKKNMKATEKIMLAASFYNFGCLQTAGPELLKTEQFDILNRFAKVFDLTYTRFNDLLKAERQTKEAQIELALERVRARTMAMQKSEELAETSYVLFQQFNELNEGADQISIGIFDEEEEVMKLYSTFHGNQWDQPASIEYNKHPVYQRMVDAWKAQKKSLVTDLTGAELHDFNKFKLKITGYNVPEDELAKDRWVVYTAYFSNGVLSYASHEPRPKESIQLLERFASVFDGTYTRFLDLQKAEAQAKESQIQLALERVRARTMAMQRSDELPETAYILFQQFKELGEDPIQITIGIFKEEERKIEFSITGLDGSGSKIDQSFKMDIDEPILLSGIYNAWKEQKPSAVFEFSGKELSDWIAYRNKVGGFLQQRTTINPGDRRFVSAGFFSKGFISFSKAESIPGETIRILERFAGVFDLTYTRFLDLKQAEAQARESKIEAALERVRSRTMAMHQTSELQEVIHTVHKELLNLNLSIDGGSFVVINEDVGPGLRCWGSGGTADTSEEVQVPHFNMSFCTDLIDGIKRGPGFFTEEFSHEEKKEYFTKLFEHKPWSDLSSEQKKATLAGLGGYTRSVAVSNHTSIFVINHHGKKFTEAENDILKRFAKVFEQTYTRFLDLQKAEAQAKEAQIELALERVRARTMAMHRSEELAETAQVLFHQLQELGGAPDRIAIGVVDEAAGFVNFWTTDQLGSHIDKSFKARLDERTVISKTYEAWKGQKRSLVIDLHGEDLKEWIRFAREEMGIVVKDEQIKDRRVHHFAFFSHGWILVTTHEPQSQETIQILERFASVFNLTYRRFLDLQKAEAQAREAQIGAALERVRSRSLAMHKSDELQEVVNTVFERLTDLNVEMDSCNIAIFKEGTRDYDYWIASHFQKRAASFHMPYVNLSLTRDLIAARERGADFSSTSYSFEEKNEWFDYAFMNTDFKFLSEERKQFILNAPAITVGIAFSKHTGVQVNRYNSKLLTEGEAEILKRFSKVFEQAYIRFLDLEKAEAQGREAQIEAALERVRSGSLAMHKSEELKDVVKVVFENFRSLGLQNIDAVNINIFHEGSRDFDLWLAAPGQDYTTNFRLPYLDHPIANDFFNAVKKRESIHQGIYDYDLKNKYFEYMFEHSDNKHLPEERKKIILNGRGYSVATGIAKHSSIFIHNYDGEAFSEEANAILVRFSKVFDQAYTRFLDLQKAEAQARESQIEASLERVRSKTMAMHNSNDVGETVAAMFNEFVNLGIHTNRCGILIFNDETSAEVWTARSNPEGKANLVIGKLNLEVHGLLISVYKAWRSQKSFNQYELIGDDIIKYYESINNSKFYPTQFDLSKLPAKEIHSDFFFPEGAVFAFTNEPIAEEHAKIFKRFAGVFGQTYRRYLDLQRAEAQAREAQIEASLERVRAKAMAMHKSEDLHTAVATVFEELDRLKLGLIRCGIAILDKEEPRGDIWITIKSDEGSTVQVAGDEPLDIHPLLHGAYNAWLRKEDFSYVLKDEDMQDYYKAITKTNFQSTITSTFDIEKRDQQQFYFNAVFQDGSLFAFLDTAFTDEAKLVMKRFANVFNLTYKRFLDLQKAEANAREAQIEAGLERVRARTMAMHSSEDVSTATATMFTELEKLGIENLRGGITIIKPDQTQEVWSITNLPDGRTIRAIGVFDMRLHPLWRALFKAKENKEGYDYYWLAGKDKEDYIKILNATPNYLVQPIKEIPDVHVQSYFFGEGGVWTNSLQPHSEEDKQVMKKFASVFSLTFRRYQDLKKAEAQAREATIEAALEKVRGKAMAMHNSNDLSVTTSLIIGELRKLGITPIRCGVGIISRETQKAQLYTATTSADGDSLSVVGWVMLKGHPVLESIYENFVAGQDYFPELTGDSMRSYYEKLLAGLSVPLPDFNAAQKHYGHFFAVSVGCLYTWSDTRYNDDEIKILKRFATIIDLTFRRYFELQKSEANAREAMKQAALDRVRADIASMRSVSDLDRITPLIWNELKTLNIPFIRCGVFIMDEDQQLIHTFLSTPDGKAIAAFHLPYDTPGNISKVIDNWRYKKIYVDHWGEEEFIQFADILMKQGSLTSREQYLKTIPRGGFYLHFLPFLQGMLYVGNTEQLNEEQIELIQHVADAFSTAYARYEDFNKLEAAKQQVENTLTDLKQAQTQLVQSEKMASLGELTAGIAHEIQNPLNFVNNFSEVSKELLDEMKEELATGNGQQAIEIAEDIIQNLEKINHHGKRADAIVKSMLQHSRSSSGKKEPTDINALADEYLRLAYHGLRAKDKSFNAKFETGFDNSIGKINIISQDIGRVLVNLINNAFYAVSERKKLESNGYEPTVEVFTKKIADKIEIKVKDNGSGIPQKVLDKIFQPFFTTKPTGQGTGLGLSLAYDIITKGHGGELKVETKEGQGSEFIIQLSAT